MITICMIWGIQITAIYIKLLFKVIYVKIRVAMTTIYSNHIQFGSIFDGKDTLMVILDARI